MYLAPLLGFSCQKSGGRAGDNVISAGSETHGPEIWRSRDAALQRGFRGFYYSFLTSIVLLLLLRSIIILIGTTFITVLLLVFALVPGSYNQGIAIAAIVFHK